MGQISFSDAEYAGKRKKTRREVFLEEMEQVVPWKALLGLIEPRCKQSPLQLHLWRDGSLRLKELRCRRNSLMHLRRVSCADSNLRGANQLLRRTAG